MSFIIIGSYWVIHHNSMHAIKRTDRAFLWLKHPAFVVRELYSVSNFVAGPIIIYGLTLITCNAVGIITVVYVYYHPHLAVAEFSKQ